MATYICQGCGAELTTWSGSCPSCRSTERIELSPGSDRFVGRVIKGRWRIIRKLGQGGMGSVYLAEKVGLGHRVAIKFLRADLSTDVELARRFLNEAKSYALVSHPNAVTLHDFDQDEEGSLFIVMEYCEGVDLKRVLAERKRFQVNEAVEVVLQVADVLAHAHQKGIVHRDLKPENIMMLQGMRGIHVKVLDFGIARLVNQSTRLTVAGSIAGTPRYMAPEQVEGREADHRVDVYSLGVVLFELLTGVQPFDGQSVSEILRAQVIRPMPHLADIDAALDFPEIDALIQHACAKRRDERLGDMGQLANALAQAVPTQLNRTGILYPSAPAVTPGDTGPAMAHTLVRATPLASGGLATPLSGELPPVGIPQPEAAAPPPVAPRTSPARWIGAVVTVVLVVGAGAWVAAGPGRASRGTAAGSEQPAPVAAAPTPLPPAAGDAAMVNLFEAQATEARAVDFLARGEQAFGRGALTEAVEFLAAVPTQAADPSRRAGELLAKIAEIRALLSRAEQAHQRGDCGAAAGHWRAVLALNPRVGAAATGIAQCKQAERPATLE